MEAGNVDLNAVNYAGLQELAKKCGLKANVKAEKLRDNLRNHLKNTGKTLENDTKRIQKRVRRRTFDLDEAALGPLTPEIDKKIENGFKRSTRASNKNDDPPAKQWKLIDDEPVRPVANDVTRRIALRPQRILRKAQTDQSQIPRPARIVGDAAAKKATPDFARIHKRIFDKMDSVDEYVEKKRFRAKQLQNGETPSVVKKAAAVVGRRAVFVPTVLNVKDANFNFAKNSVQLVQFRASKIPIAKAKSAENQDPGRAKTRLDHRQMYKARKVKSETTKGKLQQYVKGVRTNRRFDLQMQMRAAGTT